MARRKTKGQYGRDGHCTLRHLEVLKLNLCDYFERTKKNIKPYCKNCVHFQAIGTKTKKQNQVTEDDA